MVVAITRSDLSGDALRLVARRSKDSCQARRLLALAQVLDGRPRGEAARAGGRQTLRDWVHRYNAQGVEGLCDRRRSGRPPRRRNWLSWLAWWRPARIRRCTGWCVGAASTFRGRSRRALGSASAMWAGY